MSLPPTSPRLPSPPPPAEIQIGPPSPSTGLNSTRQAQQMEQSTIDGNAKRRIHPGTKASKMAAGPPLVPLGELDSAFQLQEHLAALHYHHTESNTRPITRDAAKMLATPPPGIDKTLWLYELCSAATCPEMRASEWQFLCAVHDAPKSCCAIDYCCHTLDWAANVVTNAKIFPSRFVVDAHDKSTALKNLVNVFRRLHRIFAHAWFQHRGVFWSVEGQTGLYIMFKTVCDVYDLLSSENYKLPPEAEGLEPIPAPPAEPAERKVPTQVQPTAIAKRDMSSRGAENEDFNPVGRTNTRRHIKSSPSTGSAVSTVLEADEDDGTHLTGKMRNMRLAASQPLEEEDETIDVPVIVEHGIMDQPPLRPSSVIPRSPEPESERQSKHIMAMEPELPAATNFNSQLESSAAHVTPAPESVPEAKMRATESQAVPETEATTKTTDETEAEDVAPSADSLKETETVAAEEAETPQEPSGVDASAAPSEDKDAAAGLKEDQTAEGSVDTANETAAPSDDNGNADKGPEQAEQDSAKDTEPTPETTIENKLKKESEVEVKTEAVPPAEAVEATSA